MKLRYTEFSEKKLSEIPLRIKAFGKEVPSGWVLGIPDVLAVMRNVGITPQWDLAQVISLWSIPQFRVRFMTVKRCHR